jgi:hypothetical protein
LKKILKLILIKKMKEFFQKNKKKGKKKIKNEEIEEKEKKMKKLKKKKLKKKKRKKKKLKKIIKIIDYQKKINININCGTKTVRSGLLRKTFVKCPFHDCKEPVIYNYVGNLINHLIKDHNLNKKESKKKVEQFKETIYR